MMRYSKIYFAVMALPVVTSSVALPASAQLLAPLIQESSFSQNADTFSQASLGLEVEDSLQARGVLKAAQQAEISARIPATITKLPYKSGQYFSADALLVSFDCSRERAELEALEFSLQALSVQHENTLELYNAGAAGELEESIARAEKARAAADIRVSQTRLTECDIYAPFAGYVKTRHVSAHDTPAAGTPLLSILRAGRPEITLIAPSAWMRWMKAGTSFEFTIDETGGTHKAKIIRLGAFVDPVSQTIEVTAQFTSSAKGALSGMSGVASFSPPSPKKSAP